MEKENAKSIQSPQPAIKEDIEQEIDHLKKVIHLKNAEIDVLKYQSAAFTHKTISVSKSTFVILLFFIVSLLSILVYSFMNSKKENYTYTATIQDSLLSPDTTLSEDKINEIIYNESVYEYPISNKERIENLAVEDPEPIKGKESEKDAKPKTEKLVKNKENIKVERKLILSKELEAKKDVKKKLVITKKPVIVKKPVIEDEYEYDSTYFDKPVRYEKYTINTPRAYLYNSPEVSAKGNYFMVPSRSTELSAIEEENGFIYITFLNSEGKLSKGWLRKIDLYQIY